MKSVGLAALVIVTSLGSAQAKPPWEYGKGWGAFWRCWADRDFEGTGGTFTGGCWDHTLSAPAKELEGEKVETLMTFAKEARQARAEVIEEMGVEAGAVKENDELNAEITETLAEKLYPSFTEVMKKIEAPE